MNGSKIEKYWKILNNTIDLFSTGYKQNHGECPIPEGFIKQNITESGENKELARQEMLSEFQEGVSGCNLCSLGLDRQMMIDSGSIKSEIFVIGESPSAEDFVNKKVFSGERGEFLAKWIESIGQSYEENCFLTCLIKCRTDESQLAGDKIGESLLSGDKIGDAKSLQKNIEFCLPYLTQQIEIIEPKVILCLGNTVACALLDCGDVDLLYRDDLSYQDIPVYVFNTLEEVMEDARLKRPVWEYLKKIRQNFE